MTALAGLGLWRLRQNLNNPIHALANGADKVSEAPGACPKCGSANVRRASTVGFVADLFELFGRLPFRCRVCRKRFYRASPPPEVETTNITRNLP